MQQKITGQLTTIKLSSLASGNYFVTVIENEKPSGTRLFILTK